MCPDVFCAKRLEMFGGLLAHELRYLSKFCNRIMKITTNKQKQHETTPNDGASGYAPVKCR